MLAWSWGTWPDPLVDYGTHLYVPWRLSVGQVLYRDIAYYNGPLSPYFNAALFRLFGVRMHTLIAANLCVLAVALVLTGYLVRAASGAVAAGMATLTFVLVFAFGQGVGIGNYNWVTPYAHEFTHGLTLGGLTLVSVYRFHRTGRERWLIIGGLACGAAVLTKAEPSAAALAGGVSQLVAGLWIERASGRRWARSLGPFAIGVLTLPLLAVILFSNVVPLRTAISAAAGSWPWVFDRRVTALPFYRGLIGLDAVPRHLRAMLLWTGVYAAVSVPAAGLSLAVPRRSLPLKMLAAVALVAGIGFGWSEFRVDFNSMIRPLPVVLVVAGGFVLAELARLRQFRPPLPPGECGGEGDFDRKAVLGTRNHPHPNPLPEGEGTRGKLVKGVAARSVTVASGATAARAALRLGLIVFSLALLPKMVLEAHLFHYGFVLALPGTLVLIAIGAEEIPHWLARRGGSPSAFRAVGAVVWLVAVGITLYIDHGYFATKQWTILPGTPDSFRGASRALEVQQMVQLIDRTTTPGQSVDVFPQGLMINYLARRMSSTRYVNFMPPEVVTAGEDTILADLQAHPPDAVVLTTDTLDATGTWFTLDQQYSYGTKTLAWIKQHYEVVAMPTQPPQIGTYLRLWLMRPVRAG